MKIPLLDLAAQHNPIEKEIRTAIDRVLKSQYFILGPEVKGLENRIADYCGAQYAVGASSGTDALIMALMALEIGPGDEVITTPYTFFATASAIARVGARPVFVDIDPKTYNINPALISQAKTAQTKAIIPVHLYGQCADIEPILRWAKSEKIFVIEDAAQAIGAEYKDGQKAGSMGDLGCFSFFPSKNLGAMGDGGMVCANDKGLYEKLLAMRVHGSKTKYFHQWLGGNFRLDALQAAIVNVKLDSLNSWTKARQNNAAQYEALLKQTNLIAEGKVQLPLPVFPDRVFGHIYNQFVLRVENRDALRGFLTKAEIGTEIYYPLPLHLQECFKFLGYNQGDFPESEKAAQETLALPIYPGLSIQMQEYVVSKISKFYQ